MEQKTIKVFISYSWDNEDHKEWVFKLAHKISLVPYVHVIFDRYDLEPGKDIPLFIDKGISEADKVLIILTTNYALKADKREGGVGEEYSIIRSEMISYNDNQIKFIPVLREGDRDSSCPSFLKKIMDLDMRNVDKFNENYNDLLMRIFEIPKFPRPDKGDLPEILQKK